MADAGYTRLGAKAKQLGREGWTSVSGATDQSFKLIDSRDIDWSDINGVNTSISTATITGAYNKKAYKAFSDAVYKALIDSNINDGVRVASSDALGLIKIGYSSSGKNYAVQLNDYKAYVNVPWTDEKTKVVSKNSGRRSLILSPDSSAISSGIASELCYVNADDSTYLYYDISKQALIASKFTSDTTTDPSAYLFIGGKSFKMYGGSSNFGYIETDQSGGFKFTDMNGSNLVSITSGSHTINSRTSSGGGTGVWLGSDGIINTSGEVTAPSFYATSDRRLKKNISEYSSDKSILDLNVYEYDLISNDEHSIGCIAQELQELFPYLVHENGEYLTINESKLIYPLLIEVKKLRNEVDKLRVGR